MFKIFGDSGFDLAFVIMLGIFFLFWILSVIIINVSIVDSLWGLAYSAQVIIFLFTHDYTWSNVLVTVIVSIHGLRLGIFIIIRNWGHGEDKRYQDFRRRFGGPHYWWVSLFQVFILQWVLNMGVCSSFGLFMLKTAKDRINNEADVDLVKPKLALMIIGASIAFLGTVLESVADFQLSYFKSNPENKGKLLTTGAWALCKHPNYFGETVFWWGTYLFSCAVGQYWAIYSPVLITLLIIFVSGVAILEDPERKQRYGEENREYFEKTAKFIPFIW